MIEEWKIYKCKKDKNHPYASVWEISSYGRVKRDGVIIEPKLGNWGYLIFSDALVHKAEFPSVLEAGEICGIWKGGISTVLHGKQKNAGGYKWMYKEDYQKCIN